jgi:hypothetical protein
MRANSKEGIGSLATGIIKTGESASKFFVTMCCPCSLEHHSLPPIPIHSPNFPFTPQISHSLQQL